METHHSALTQHRSEFDLALDRLHGLLDKIDAQVASINEGYRQKIAELDEEARRERIRHGVG